MLKQLVSSRSELVQLGVAVAEVQGNKSQLFRDYEKVFGVADEDFDLKEVVKHEIILVVNAELRDVLKMTSFIFPFLGEGSLQYPWNSLSQELSKVMYEFLFCNEGHGNRAPVPHVPRVYECVSCSMIGLIGNVSAYVAAGLEPLKMIFMRKLHGILNQLVSSRSELVQLAVAVAEVSRHQEPVVQRL